MCAVYTKNIKPNASLKLLPIVCSDIDTKKYTQIWTLLETFLEIDVRVCSLEVAHDFIVQSAAEREVEEEHPGTLLTHSIYRE